MLFDTLALLRDAVASMSETSDLQHVDLRKLIGHTTVVHADGKLEYVYQLFGKRNVAFIAVLENERVVGMCSRWQIGMLLGSRYGFSLFSRKPIRDHLLPDALRVSVEGPIASVLEKVASRSEETFHDDVLLVDEQGSFLGLIFLAHSCNSNIASCVRMLNVWRRSSERSTPRTRRCAF